jgi:DNA (cytosine-5)-methyltransferase 1
LFTGAGGLALGSHEAGLEHVALVEWDHDAARTLRANVAASAVPGIDSWWVVETDATKVRFRDFGHVDVVIGGPPCQPFSIGGKHGGMEDNRDMLPQFVRAVRELKPRAFIMENVRGLLRQTFRTYFSYTLLQLTYPRVRRKSNDSWMEHLERLEKTHTRGRYRGLRYNVVFRQLNAADYGVPQVRHRVVLVGFRQDTGVEWHFPEPTHSREALLHDQWVTGEYWDRHELPQPDRIAGDLASHAHRLPVDTTLLRDVKPTTLAWRTVRDAFALSPALVPPGDGIDPPGFANHRYIPGARPYYGHSGSLIDMPAKTLKAGVHGVPGGENTLVVGPNGEVRYFTVRESARLQTFPDAWRFQGAWGETMRQLGNAVPVDLARLIAESVSDKLAPGDDDVKCI